MANRRISELPLLDGTQVAEQDLFTMVHVFEVDPTLKNKKNYRIRFKAISKFILPNSKWLHSLRFFSCSK
jgi:hypothetical protein